MYSSVCEGKDHCFNHFVEETESIDFILLRKRTEAVFKYIVNRIVDAMNRKLLRVKNLMQKMHSAELLVKKQNQKEAKSEAIELFDSIQLGVGVSEGAEAIIHSAKITYEKILNADSKEGVLQIDFRNAFNSVKRSHLLQAACDFITGFAAFTYFCYSQHVPLLYNNASLQSESGVQQGDPLGPFLFSLMLWPVIEKIRDAVPNLTQHTWYLDDGFVASSEDQIRTTLDILPNEGPKRVCI